MRDRVSVVIVVGAFAACFSKPGMPLQNDAPGSADATVMTSGLCTTGSAVKFEDFTSGTACGAAASVSQMNMTVVRQNGQMQFVPAGGSGDGAGYCTWMPFPAVDAVVAHWAKLAATDFDDNTQVEVTTATDDVLIQLIFDGNAHIKLDNNGSGGGHDWNPQELWWRIRHGGPSLAVAETSQDGSSWQPLSMTALAASSFNEMVIGRTAGSSDPATVALDALYVCQ